MVVAVSGSQETLLNQGNIQYKMLVKITNTSGTINLTNNDAFTYLGDIYQPFIGGISGFKTTANFPENNAGGESIRMTLMNVKADINGVLYPKLSNSLDGFDWEMADCDIKLLLASGTFPTTGIENKGNLAVAMPVMTSGIVGTPSNIQNDTFDLVVTTRNTKLNDLLPIRAVNKTEFGEADPDELNGRTYLPILVGSGIRVRAVATQAGAVTTVTEQVSTGTTLKVSDTTGFEGGDSFIIGGDLTTTFTIGTVDTPNKRFTLITPNLSALGKTITLGTIINEDKPFYNYTVANHKIGSVSSVLVKKRGQEDFVVISGSMYVKQAVVDTLAIGGFRTDIRINELVPLKAGSGGSVSQQPTHTVNGADHNHGVAVDLSNTTIWFANSVTPGGATAANDGNSATSYTLTTTDVELVFATHDLAVGVFVAQRYFAIVENLIITSGDWRMQRDTNIFLTVTVPNNTGEFRSSLDTGGDSDSDWKIVNNENIGGTLNVFEGWKEISVSPAVTENNVDLTNTTRTVDVAINVTGANIEIGDEVHVVCDGLQATDWHATKYGSGTITRPDYVMRWFLEEALDQTSAIIDLASYTAAGTQYQTDGTKVQLAIQEPITLDRLFDQIANSARSMHWWGREGHNLKFLEDPDALPTQAASYIENENGVIDITWDHSLSQKDIRNKLAAYYGRDWTRTAGQDEAYTGLVELQDVSSQARFGILTNEVRGENKPFFFDMVPSSSQMTDVLSFIVGHKSTPRKRFEITTDWSSMNIEPGDIVYVRTPTLLTPTLARVVENDVDPRLFCKISAISSASANVEQVLGGSSHLKSAHMFDSGSSYWADEASKDVGIADTWTIFMRMKIEDVQTKGFFSIKVLSPASNKSVIQLTQLSSPTGAVRAVILRDSDGGYGLQYEWNGVLLTDGSWQELFLTWNGTSLLLYTGVTGAATLRTVSTITASTGGALANRARAISSSSGWVGYIYNMAIWNTVLSASSRAAVSSTVIQDLRENFGNYTNSNNLKDYFLFDGDSNTNLNLGSAGDFDLFTKKSKIEGSTDIPT